MKFEMIEATWWQKILLWFIPGKEYAIKEHNAYFIVTRKTLLGTTYVVDVEQTWQD